MKNKGLWRKMLAGCLALTLSLSSSMAAFSTEEEPAAPEEAAVEEISEAVEEEEPFTVEEDDISEEGPALEAAVASVAADVVPDGLVEDLDTLEAAGDEEYITITFYGGDGVHSRRMDENGNAVTNEYGDYVYDGGSTVEEEVFRESYLSMYQYRTLFQKEGYRIRGWTSDNGIYCDYDESFGIWDYVPDDAQEWNLTAVWEPTVTVTLDAGEGSSFNTEYIGYNDYRSNSGTSCEWDVDEDYQLYLDEDLFFKEGVVLAGWNGDDGEYYSVCDQYSFTEDITLTADWAEPIEVTLDLGDGVYNNSDDPVNDGKSVIVLNKANGTVVDLDNYRQYSTLEGNKLAGWIVYDANGTQIDYYGQYDDKYWVDGPVTLMADWKTAVTVTWHRNLYDGDTFSTEDIKYAGELIAMSDARDLWDDDPEIEDSGLLLAGVLQGSTSGTLLHFSDELLAVEGLHLYLNWMEPVILTLNPNGGFFGSEDETEPKEVPVAPGEDIYVDDLDTPDFNGKIFLGWEYEDGTPAFPYDEENDEEIPEVFEKDTTLYAVWEEAYTVMLDPNGGYWYEDTNETAPRPYYLQKGANLYWSELDEPYHTSKMLLGWADEQGKLVLPLYEYDRETGDDAYITPSGNMTLKAVWADPVTVTIVGGDGAKSKVWDDDGYSFDGPSTIQVKCAKGGNFTELDRDYFEKEGYIINGWKIGNAVYSDPWYSFKPTGNVTVTAVWAKEVTVSWHLMGGYIPSTYYYQYNDFCVQFAEGDRIDSYDVMKDGFVLAGWNTTQKGAESGTVVYPVEYDLTASDDLGLFAVWKQAYTVTFDGNGGTHYDDLHGTWVETVDVPIMQEAELNTISWPDFKYEVDGKAMAIEYWSTTDPNVEDPVEADWSQIVEGDMPLYAVWAPGAVITFNLNGGYTWDHDGKTDKYQEVLTMDWGLFRHSYYWGTAPAGKTFVGWTTVKNDPSTLLPDYIPGPSTEPFFGSGDKELFALWSAAPGTKLTGSDGASYTVGKEGDVTYNAPKNKTKIKSATVPDKVTIGGSVYNVTSIAANAFSGAKKLKTVKIGSNIRTIGAKAFFKTPLLRTVTINSANITSIGSKAFQKAGSKNYKKLKVKVPASKKAAYTTMLKKAKLNKKSKVK